MTTLPWADMTFLERLTKEHIIIGVDQNTFQPYTIELKNPILTFSTGSEIRTNSEESQMEVWSVFIHDGDQFIGTFKFGTKVYKGNTSYLTTFVRHEVETTV